MSAPIGLEPDAAKTAGLPDPDHAPSRSLAVLVLTPLCAVLLFAARLMWQAHRNEALDFEQLLAYGAFLAVAGSGPVVVVLLLRRLSTPLSSTATRPTVLSPLVACIGLSLAIAVTALLIYQVGSDFVGRGVSRRLEAVATLKASIVQNWVNDARDDVKLAGSSPAFHSDIEDWRAAGPHEEVARQRLLDDLWRLSKTGHYVEISLRDPASGALLLTTTGDGDTPEVRRQAVAAAAATLPLLEEFHGDAERGDLGANYLGFFSLLTPPVGGPLVLHVGIDPRHELFPLIEQWPGASGTAEVLLARIENDALVVLNDTSPNALARSRRHVSASQPQNFAAALARGQQGALRGDDDRHHAVLAHAVPVEGTAWFVVAKLDEAEAFAELNRVALLAASIVGAMLLLGAWWWVEHQRHVAVERQHLAERADHVRRLAELSQRVVSVQEEERRRWSSELHDHVGANLAAININLKAIGRALPGRSEEDNDLLSETSELLNETIASIREFCNTLRPAILDYAGLVPALEASVEQARRRSGARVEFHHEQFAGRCHIELENVLFRIVQEALMNCTKHAKARHVNVRLEGSPREWRLTIEDDGVGFDPARLGQAAAAGHGLLNMRERAAYIGASFEVDSRPGRGTRVCVASAAT